MCTDAGLQWAADACLPAAILLAAVSIMHPKLFKEGIEGMKKLNQYADESDSKMAMALQHWSSVFTNMQLIANHSAPLHRDANTLTPWFDLPCTVSDYEDCFMYIPTLGVILEYPPGTVVTFSGCLLRHAVSRVEGNRYTMAVMTGSSRRGRAGVSFLVATVGSTFTTLL